MPPGNSATWQLRHLATPPPGNSTTDRLGWRWTIAAVDPGGAIRFLDPAKASRGRKGARAVRLGEAAAVDNLAAWLDRSGRSR